MPFRENQCVHIPVPSHTYTERSAESLSSNQALCEDVVNSANVQKWRGVGLLFKGL